MLLAIRNLAHESRQEIHAHYLYFHMEKSVSTILISPCDFLGKIFITSISNYIIWMISSFWIIILSILWYNIYVDYPNLEINLEK